MIALLRGRIASTGLDSLVVEVGSDASGSGGGVGYLVSASTRTLAAVGGPGAPVLLHVETQVREDAIQLFGFATEAERDWFRLLYSVQGVGGRVALAILSVLGPAELRDAVARQDKASVARANGVGPKLAQRIVNELKDRAGLMPGAGGDLGVGALPPSVPTPATAADEAARDTLSALANLGFRPADAARALADARAELGDAAPVGDLLRVALRRSARA